ncbi:putative membrane protein [Yersinia pestis PY-66]|uniref:Uncharacterized protein n=4 Tax=Yersinia pestis TaxID=632 RepID=Q8CKL8_YERPE|nr:hypothetical [Yersinia pestis KIM10+]ABG12332.1 conserved hypothetical protein [Yersinia pestis Antiqua]ABP39021.1 conserved hypothetical protein [Yersinia pestis Pestoides F]ABX87890.1 conserved hypothetical protein [Yersinia pestis Angola]EDR33306.1 conserved hypothetical protein [Yersinia pestis biovar Orientalis str. IP275]EDR50655.1 conserved hypothetical protein [Yersinia pestis biovar Antiqua str. B42003004]EDR65441.1 conserved hypothetical protein [Yersinia pestis biovar Mediaevali
MCWCILIYIIIRIHQLIFLWFYFIGIFSGFLSSNDSFIHDK